MPLVYIAAFAPVVLLLGAMLWLLFDELFKRRK
jgi:hypothetical protein